ncbi:MAG: hypothetical protein COV74_00095 [Candidatus Omnitrophica bacterium CG11_big_fil_rev_8_21_14_0_20_45_26]|uniref:diguanylate cyclase n=1 Tax=Candidatus Abzuiibacterium crystallinum TaxID=1974748 RepID=A0A2H0LVR4_9BACT|nr:MAG: hypothetical protein COV74_00095 [Candidatus Omnitrophica bacterium CG11_big_fil_rev_8_21_14_0_20_45_26]PIW65733.1 MAG: hypothetical protein COW12_00495 [Candidatus Omnitrophica bacterium CG12_big_fil_rev_8_21_14_0_65_45_16]
MEHAFNRFKEFLSKPLPLACVLTIIFMNIFMTVPFFAQVDLLGRDFLLRLRESFSQPPFEVDDIVLVTLDDQTTREMKDKWPLPRSLYAKSVNIMMESKPKVIGFDFVFQGADQEAGSDQALADELSKAGNVVIASYLSPEGDLIAGHEPIREAAHRSAIVNKVLDRDGVVRRAPLYFRDPHTGEIRWSWESEIFFKAKGIENPQVTETKNETIISGKFGDLTIPARRGVMDINYLLRLTDIQQVPFWRVLSRQFDPDIFRNKIILTGLTALAFHDFHKTPLGTISGLALNANTIVTLLSHHFLTRIPLIFTWFLVLLSLWFIIRVTDRYSILISFTVVLCLAFTYVAISGMLLWWHVIWDLTYAAMVSILTFFFAVLFKQFQTALENIRLREESVRDPLTGFYTRRFLEVHLKMDVKKVLAGGRSQGHIDSVAVVMIDLDNFKLVNDTFGHQEGDRVLKILGESIRNAVRKEELVCRFGGDEFCVILPGTTLENAIKFSEKLRNVILGNDQLSYTTKAGVQSFRVTGSFGVSAIKGKQAMTAENLLKAADRALYRAKKGGRNQVCVFDPEKDVLDGD